VAGVKAANLLDKRIECARDKIAEHIKQRIGQVAHNVTGSNGPTVLDSNEHDHDDQIC
jgi:hypothetical protein